jgi:hypothetical protein
MYHRQQRHFDAIDQPPIAISGCDVPSLRADSQNKRPLQPRRDQSSRSGTNMNQGVATGGVHGSFSSGLQTIASRIENRIHQRDEEVELLRQAELAHQQLLSRQDAALEAYKNARIHYLNYTRDLFSDELNSYKEQERIQAQQLEMAEMRQQSEEIRSETQLEKIQWESQMVPLLTTHRTKRWLYDKVLSETIAERDFQRNLRTDRINFLQTGVRRFRDQIKSLQNAQNSDGTDCSVSAPGAEDLVNSQIQSYANQVRETLAKVRNVFYPAYVMLGQLTVRIESLVLFYVQTR